MGVGVGLGWEPSRYYYLLILIEHAAFAHAKLTRSYNIYARGTADRRARAHPRQPGHRHAAPATAPTAHG